jgi:sarcosine oxidase subunit alpha
MSGRRLPTGGNRIDRSRSIRFTFDGRELEGFGGDTLASALLASGVDVVCRSPILGRPRGVFSAGVEEPSAFVEVSRPWFDPIVAATMVELVDDLVARGRPGVGVLPTEPPSTRSAVHRHAHVETLVIGSGPAGVEAAVEAADRGGRVLIVDRMPRGLGSPSENVRTLARTTALGVYDDGFVILHQRGAAIDTLWHVRAGRVILATGAHERPIAFANGDRPGVMLAGAITRYVRDFGVLPGERAVIFTTNDSTHDVARTLTDAGAEIAALVDVREGWSVADVAGSPAVAAVRLAGPRGETRTVDADLVAVSGGWNPAIQLARAIGAGLRFDDRRSTYVPDGTGPPWLEVVGAAAGEGLPDTDPFWFTPAEDLSTHLVDLQRDQTVQDVLDAVGGGLRSVEHVKRATYIGTAIDQGRMSGTMTAEIVNEAIGWELGAQGPTSARPPYVPVAFSVLAGLDRGLLLDPVRTTPIHQAHVERGAVFENVGQWKRPRFFPVGGDDMEAAVARECLAVRTAAGALDASTLGKIEVVGPDAPAFLDRMYTNRMSNLAIGAIRYGLMLGLDGMVYDDGVAMRLARDRFLVTTTTGGAAAVLDRFEEWLQTEWPDLRVYCTSVTEQWAVIAVGGPDARSIVGAIGADVPLDAASFPWMTWRDGTVDGVPCRLCRVSFHGELSFELHVSAWHGRHVWDAVVDAGALPYGTEAMHVLRAEKGYVIVGQDTDGTATPDDLGMGWIVNPSKGDFVGKRSLVRSDTSRADRKHLVGLLPDDPGAPLAEGSQLVAVRDPGPPPVPMLGHVTSSYRSPTLGRRFALGMVEGGRALRGQTIFAATPTATLPVRVVDPVFYDPKGDRRDG